MNEKFDEAKNDIKETEAELGKYLKQQCKNFNVVSILPTFSILEPDISDNKFKIRYKIN